jgi:prepilin-type N-terminal cleavage/methylation domain-containing protein
MAGGGRAPGCVARGQAPGFTLVELMIAITVLLVAVLATFVSQLRARDLIRTARDTEVATGDLEAAMERVLVFPPDQLPGPAGRFPDGQPIAAFEGLHLANESIVVTYPGFAGGEVPDPLSIVLTLTFDDFSGRPRVMRLASMKTR